MYKVQYRGLAGDGFSPKIWSKVKLLEMWMDNALGYVNADEFLSFGGTVTSNVGSYASQGGAYKSFETTSCAISQLDTVAGGAITLLSNGADNDTIVLERGSGNGGSFLYTAGTGKRLYYETRIRPNAAWDVSAAKDLFVGLITKGMSAAATTLFSNTAGTMTGAGVNAIGFTLLNSGSALKTCLQKGAVVRTPVAAATLVAGTWNKVGFYVNHEDPTYQLRYFVNNVQVDAVADTNTAFPTALQLVEAFALKLQASDAGSGLDLDWYRAAQER